MSRFRENYSPKSIYNTFTKPENKFIKALTIIALWIVINVLILAIFVIPLIAAMENSK